jgi:hypothetical protein
MSLVHEVFFFKSPDYISDLQNGVRFLKKKRNEWASLLKKMENFGMS